RDGDWYRFWRGAVQVRFCCDKRLASIHWAQLELEEADAGVAGALRALHRLSQECELAEIAHGHIGEALRLLELGDLFGAAQFAGRADWATFGERGPVRAAVEQAIEDLR